MTAAMRVSLDAKQMSQFCAPTGLCYISSRFIALKMLLIPNQTTTYA